MSDDPEYERRLQELLHRAPLLKLHLEQLRGFAKDSAGRTVVLGLTHDETEEFVRLDPPITADIMHEGPRRGRFDPEFKKIRERYEQLRHKHDEARIKDAAENLDFWSGSQRKQ